MQDTLAEFYCQPDFTATMTYNNHRSIKKHITAIHMNKHLNSAVSISDYYYDDNNAEPGTVNIIKIYICTYLQSQRQRLATAGNSVIALSPILKTQLIIAQ
jgi:hypothetical protein